VNQPTVLLAMEREEDSNSLGQFGTERSPSMYMRMRATLSTTLFVSVRQVGINFSPFGEPAVLH
jgi:hypothetical protein